MTTRYDVSVRVVILFEFRNTLYEVYCKFADKAHLLLC